MKRTTINLAVGLLISVVMLIGGAATAVGAAAQRAVAIRGWADPVQTAELPGQVPLAGVNVELRQYDPETLDRELGKIAAAGFVWVRQTFAWPDIEPAKGEFTFSKYDLIVKAVAAHPTLKLVAVLNDTPAWARRIEASDRMPAPPSSMAAFADFAGQVAARYSNQIDYYQVWDEPNLNTQWGGLDPQPADYAAMLRAAYTSIHGHDSTATVILAALAPTVETGPRNLNDALYLRMLYDLDAGKYFDVAAGKPYGFDFSPEDRTTRADVLNFSHIILMREEMVRHGDGGKALWGSYFGWNHLPAGWTSSPSIWGQVDAETQMQYIRQAYQRAEREWPWMGGLILEHWQPDAAADDPIQGFAVASVAADWFENGKFFERPVLGPGLHDPTDARIKYDGNWRTGPLGADVQYKDNTQAVEDGSDHQVTFTFEGTSLALLVRRAKEIAYVYARVDGQAANSLPLSSNGAGYFLLKSPDLEPHTELVVLAKNLSSGQHTANVRFYLGKDQWALAGIAVGSTPDTWRFDLLILAGAIVGLIGLIGAVFTGVRLAPLVANRAGVIPAMVAYVRHMAYILAGLIVSGLAILGMIVTWNGALPQIVQRDTPTLALTVITAGLIYFRPVFILTVIALIVLWLLIYNRPAVGLALTLFWAPFFLAPVQLYIWALPMVELCLILTVSAAAVRAIGQVIVKRQRFSIRAIRGLDWAILAFVGVATITILWSEQRGPAIREWRTMVIEPALFYLVLRSSNLSKHELARLVDVLLLAGTVIVMLGLIGFVRGGSSVVIAESGSRRLAGVYGSYASPNNLALFLGRCIPFGLAMALIAPGNFRRVVAGIIVVLMGIAAVLTQSGGALILGIPASVVCVLILWEHRWSKIAAGAVVAAMVLAIPILQLVPRFQGVLDLTRSSSFARTQVWTSAINLLKERPVTGAGLDQFLYLYRSRYMLPDAFREPDLSHPHNFVLDYWVSLGILGLAILVALQITFWRAALAAWRSWKRVDPLMTALAIGAMGSVVDFLAHGLVDNSYFVIDLAFIFCFTTGLVMELKKLGEQKQSTQVSEA